VDTNIVIVLDLNGPQLTPKLIVVYTEFNDKCCKLYTYVVAILYSHYAQHEPFDMFPFTTSEKL